MPSISISYTSVDGAGASLGVAGTHTLLADRPAGTASGTGLGFNGGELLALSLGGCFCNDLHYTAADLGLVLTRLHVTVELVLEGDPLVVTSAKVDAQVALADGSDPEHLIAEAQRRCTIANSLKKGVEVDFV